jgi:preprotein translocase subunit YajC
MTTPLSPATLSLSSLLQLPTSGNPLFGPLFMYAAIFAIFYFILIRPQQRQRKQHELTIQNLKKGDKVVTAGGVIGDVVHIKPVAPDGKATAEDEVTIKSGESRLVVERGRIARIVTASANPASNTAA